MKILLSLVLLTLSTMAKSQEVSIEKSIFGIQTGILGIWVNNEAKLTKNLALRSELGLNTNLFGGSGYDGTGFIMSAVFTLEPKWYYNLKKRASKSRVISRNSANFISLQASFHPDWFIFSNYDNVSLINQFSIIPTWGIRRNMGVNFTYEAGIGLGYRYLFIENGGNKGETAYNLHLRIGYDFK